GIPVLLLAAGIGLGTPLVFLVLPAALIALRKRRRRTRRRGRGEPTERLLGAFDEIADLGRDLGRPVPPRTTRTEIAHLLGGGPIHDLAARADTAGFGSGDRTEDDV